MTSPGNDAVRVSVDFIRGRTGLKPDLAVVLGSGLGSFAEEQPGAVVLDTREIASFPRSMVPGHRGRIIIGEILGRNVILFQGRVHLYETASVKASLHPIEVAAALGAKTLLLTNAAGGISPNLYPGCLMVIAGQLNLTSKTSSETAKITVGHKIGYAEHLVQLLVDIGRNNRLPVQSGVYAGLLGPSYETAAEIAMLHRLGANAVGMSTVLEAQWAWEHGMTVAGVSCITNMATGISDKALSHEEVELVATRVRSDFAILLQGFIRLSPPPPLQSL